MAIKIDRTDERGQIYGYWIVEQYIQITPGPQNSNIGKLIATVIGYKNKAARDAGLMGWSNTYSITGAAWSQNMNMNQIEAYITTLPDFSGSVTTA